MTIELYDGRRRLGRKKTLHPLAFFTSPDTSFLGSTLSQYSPVSVNFASIRDGSLDGLIKLKTNTPGSGYSVNVDDVAFFLSSPGPSGLGWSTHEKDFSVDISVKGKARPHQVVFLNFDGGVAGLEFDPLSKIQAGSTADAFAYKTEKFSAPKKFRLGTETIEQTTQRLKHQITSLVHSEFYEYGIEVVDKRPSTVSTPPFQ